MLCLSVVFAADEKAVDDEEFAKVKFPDRYFSTNFDSYYTSDWSILFPENPPFEYACLYQPSFDHEFGFYLKGNELHWARAAGWCRLSALGDCPIVRLELRVAEEAHPGDPFAPPSPATVADNILSLLRDATSITEEKLNESLYSRDYVKRGVSRLSPALADALRRTFDESVTARTFDMEAFHLMMQCLDGNYCLFRGAKGPVAESHVHRRAPMRDAMMVLAGALIDMATMDDLTPENEKWLIAQCDKIRRLAKEMGDAPPPMNDDDWAQRYVEWYLGERSKAQEAAEAEHSDKPSPPPAMPEDDEKLNRRYEAEFEKRYCRPLAVNSLWRELFPKGSEGKPGVMWFDIALRGCYLDGQTLVTATKWQNGATELRKHMFGGVPEKTLMPYDAEIYGVDGLKREWMTLSRSAAADFSRGLTILAHRSSAPRRNVRDNALLVIRSADGSSRITTADDSDCQEACEWLEAFFGFHFFDQKEYDANLKAVTDRLKAAQ